MLKKEALIDIPVGAGLTYISSPKAEHPYKMYALFLGFERARTDLEKAVFVTQNGAMSKPMMKNYGKTWVVEKINVGNGCIQMSTDEFETATTALYELADEYQVILDNGPDDPFDRVEQRKALLHKMRELCEKLESVRKEGEE